MCTWLCECVCLDTLYTWLDVWLAVSVFMLLCLYVYRLCVSLCFVLFRLIKNCSFNLLCVLDLYSLPSVWIHGRIQLVCLTQLLSTCMVVFVGLSALYLASLLVCMLCCVYDLRCVCWSFPIVCIGMDILVCAFLTVHIRPCHTGVHALQIGLVGVDQFF